MYLHAVENNELIEIITSFKNNSCPGPDGIPFKLIKISHVHYIQPMLHILNLILNTRTIPKIFKNSQVTPEFKNGDTKNINNYRPISQINTFGKIFEKWVKNRLLKYLMKHNLLSKRQSGFLPGFSTETASTASTDHIYGNF